MKKTSKTKSSPSRHKSAVGASSKSRLWQLTHRRHTGRLLPHAHTSYPVLAMILLLTGVFMGGMSQIGNAAPNDIAVTASLPGPAPTVAATIATPSDGTRFTNKPITVTGSCPAGTYIELQRNGISSGFAICQADKTYSISTDLFVGTNALQAQVYNTTDVPGPNSAITTVYYNPPVPTSQPQAPASPTPFTSPTNANGTTVRPTPSAANPASAATSPLVLQSKFTFVGHYAGNLSSYDFSIAGGTAPYAISIDWGDGTQKLVTITTNGPFVVDHIYEKAGGFQGIYVIKVTAVDSAGNQTILQLMTIVTNRSLAGTGGLTSTGNGSADATGRSIGFGAIKNYIWSAYGIVVLMVLSFWIGELRELRLLRPHRRRSHRV